MSVVSERSLYDPVYNDLTVRRRFWDLESKEVAEHFSELIRTYAFTRLSFIKQEGLTWLEFPTASYTRYSAALGSWHLADVALENVQILPKKREPGQSPWLHNWLEELDWVEEFRLALLLHDLGHFPFTTTIETNDVLKKKYKEQTRGQDYAGVDLQHEDFSIALVMGDEPYPDLKLPNHDDDKYQRIFSLFREFNTLRYSRCNTRLSLEEVKSKFPDLDLTEENEERVNKGYGLYSLLSDEQKSEFGKFNDSLLVSKTIQELNRRPHRSESEQTEGREAIEMEKLIYLLNPRMKEPQIGRGDNKRDMTEGEIALMRLVRHLVIGVIDLGHLDRYRRISSMLRGKPRDMSRDWLLNHLAMDLRDPANPHFLIFGEGVDQMFRVLNDFKLNRRDVLHNPRRLAYETMLNDAINDHWTVATDNFRQYLPFLDDDQLFTKLRHSDNDRARDTIQDILMRRPLRCVARFEFDCSTLPEEVVPRELPSIQGARRRYVTSRFEPTGNHEADSGDGRSERLRRLLGETCIVRLTKSFGAPTPAEVENWNKGRAEDDQWSPPRDQWMDLRWFWAGDESAGDAKGPRGIPLVPDARQAAELSKRDRKKYDEEFASRVERIEKDNLSHTNSFWVFLRHDFEEYVSNFNIDCRHENERIEPGDLSIEVMKYAKSFGAKVADQYVFDEV